MKKLKKFAAQTRSILKFERKQAKQNQRIGFRKAKIDQDLSRAIWFWMGFLAGGVMGFYYATLYFLAKYCN